MKIFGMGGVELVIILVVILLIFGPKNLPKLGSAFGKTISNLRSGMNEGKKKDPEPEAADAADEETEAADEPSAPAILEGQVEEVIEDTSSDIAGAAEDAVAEANAAVDEAFAETPRKVKRVVRKKISTD